MNTKVYKMLVAANQTDGNGTSTSGNVLSSTNPASGVVAILDNKNNVMDSSPTYAEALASGPSIFIGQGQGSGKYPILSSPIQLSNIRGAVLGLYAPAARQTTIVGYNRVLAAGNIEPNASSTDTKMYVMHIAFLGDKENYSNRTDYRTYQYVAAASATQRDIAIYFANRINQDGVAKATAIVVGDGTGVAAATSTTPLIIGGTGATNYGIEITSNGQPAWESFNAPFMDFFKVSLDTGFTTATEISTVQEHVKGNGTLQHIRELEYNAQGWDGLTNRNKFPFPTPASFVSTTGFTLAVTPTATVVQGSDSVTFSATVAAILLPGDIITINGETCEIKYFVSATVAIMTAPIVQTGAAALTVTRVVGYNLLVIEHVDEHIGGELQQLKSSNWLTTFVALPYNANAAGARTAHPIEADLVAVLTGAPIGLTAIPTVTMSDGN